MKPEPKTLNIADNKTRDGNFKIRDSFVSKPERQLNLVIISVKYFVSIYLISEPILCVRQINNVNIINISLIVKRRRATEFFRVNREILKIGFKIGSEEFCVLDELFEMNRTVWKELNGLE